MNKTFYIGLLGLIFSMQSAFAATSVIPNRNEVKTNISNTYTGSNTQDFSFSGQTVRLPIKTTPASPVTGEIYITGSSLIYYDQSGVQRAVATGSAGVGGSGVITQIPYFITNTTTLTSEAGTTVNAFTWDATNNFLGIQQVTPKCILHVGNNTTSGTVGAGAIILGVPHTTANIGAGSVIAGGSGGANGAAGADAFSFGISSYASGARSFAHGDGSTANAPNSHAEGESGGIHVSANSSHLEGKSCSIGSTGSYGHAEGDGCTANGPGGHAEGYQCSTGTGGSDHAEGSGSAATGGGAHAEGVSTIASGNISHAEGYDTSATGYAAHSGGYQTNASGIGSHAEGLSSVAAADYSHVEGETGNANALARSVHLEGKGCTANATGDYGHAEGDGCQVNGPGAHAEGYQSVASGNQAHAEGGICIASGNNSHAQGSECTASGNGAHAGGWNSTAGGNTSFSHGYRATDASNAGCFVIKDNVDAAFTATTTNQFMAKFANGAHFVDTPFYKDATVTSVNGSTAGTLKWYQPERGTGYKKVVVVLTGFNDSGETITFSVAFANTPDYIPGVGVTSLVPTSLSTTTFVLPATVGAVTGVYIIEGI